MKQNKALILAYTAGFLDGEGCIRINKRLPKNNRSMSYNLFVSITQKDGEIMDWLQGNFGGTILLNNKRKKSWIYEWRITEVKAFNFLKEILPFLKYKKKQAEIALQFQQRRIFERKRNIPDNGRFASLSQNELDKREEIYQEMCAIKKIFRKCKNPNVVEYTFKSMMQE